MRGYAGDEGLEGVVYLVVANLRGEFGVQLSMEGVCSYAAVFYGHKDSGLRVISEVGVGIFEAEFFECLDAVVAFDVDYHSSEVEK